MPFEEFDDEDLDDDVKEARLIVRMENKASTSLLQRRMDVTEERAVEIMQTLEAMGVVGPHNEDGSREVLPCDEPADDFEGDTDLEEADNE